MKLATYKDGSRDGQLIVVSRDLASAHFATGVASRMQQLLDDWNFLSPQLQDLYVSLNQGRARHAFEFVPEMCAAPLPRAYQWADGSAYLNHVELVRKARKAEVPASFYEDPLMYQGGSDDFLGPHDDARFASTDWGIDFEAEVAVIGGDVATSPRPSRPWRASAWCCWPTTGVCATWSRANWPRASVSCRASRPLPSAR
jgi:fumarylacetoacetate (FAA) hydrolase